MSATKVDKAFPGAALHARVWAPVALVCGRSSKSFRYPDRSTTSTISSRIGIISITIIMISITTAYMPFLLHGCVSVGG